MARAKKVAVKRRKKDSDVHLRSDAKPKASAGAFKLSPDQIEAIARSASDTFQHIAGLEQHAPDQQMGRAKTLLAGRKLGAGGNRIQKAETELYSAVVKALLPYKGNGSD